MFGRVTVFARNGPPLVFGTDRFVHDGLKQKAEIIRQHSATSLIFNIVLLFGRIPLLLVLVSVHLVRVS